MSLINLIDLNNKILRSHAEKVTEFGTPALLRLIEDMKETMVKENGIGLAAPQIGKSLQLFVIDREYIREIDAFEKKKGLTLKQLPFLKKIVPEVYINPRVIHVSKEKTEIEEGCLSLPLLFGLVLRPRTIEIQTYDEKGKKRSIKTGGLLAKVYQHEIEHLSGTLFIDKAYPDSLYQLKKKRASVR